MAGDSGGINATGTSVGSGTAGTPVNFADVTNVSLDGISAAVLNDSDMDITNNWETTTAGDKIAGTITIDLLFTKANTTTVFALFGATTNTYWTITGSDSSTWVCKGFMSGFSQAHPRGELITQSVTITLSGAPVYAAAS